MIKNFSNKTKILNRFLKENGVTLKEYYREVAKNYDTNIYDAICRVNILCQNDYKFLSVIDSSLTWSDTKRGSNFWSRMNEKFSNYVICHANDFKY